MSQQQKIFEQGFRRGFGIACSKYEPLLEAIVQHLEDAEESVEELNKRPETPLKLNRIRYQLNKAMELARPEDPGEPSHIDVPERDGSVEVKNDRDWSQWGDGD